MRCGRDARGRHAARGCVLWPFIKKKMWCGVERQLDHTGTVARAVNMLGDLVDGGMRANVAWDRAVHYTGQFTACTDTINSIWR